MEIDKKRGVNDKQNERDYSRLIGITHRALGEIGRWEAAVIANSATVGWDTCPDAAQLFGEDMSDGVLSWCPAPGCKGGLMDVDSTVTKSSPPRFD